LRPFREAIALCHLKQAGINVPIPLFVFVSRTAFLCGFRAVIGTEDIPEARSLLEYLRSHSNSPTIESLAQTAGAQAREALAQGVFHNDLHPGNVLVARDEEIFLIDFDGAKFLNTRADESAASEKLITRWSRFITKYGLPTAADRGFRDGVRCKANEKL
jgi:tRNA A-37 threonylcarbamoyl transferase component Bud32